MIFYYGLTDNDGKFTWMNLAKITTPENLKALGLALLLAFVSTVICLVLAYPLAMILAGRNVNQSSFVVLIFILPMWMNFLLRTLAWQNLLEKNGVINSVLHFFGLPSWNVINTPTAIILGMVYNFLPFMVLPIYNVLVKIDKDVISAARDLGAGNIQTFTKIILPLSVPGIISGITMVFVPALTTFVISNLLGGSKILLIGNVIEQEFQQGSNWHVGSGLSLVLMIFIIASMALIAKYDKDGEGTVSGLSYPFFYNILTGEISDPLSNVPELFQHTYFSGFVFNSSRTRAKWGGFTGKWYVSLFQDEAIMSTLYNTLIIALLSALIATVIGTLASIGIQSMNRKFRTFMLGVTNIPMLNADIVTGVSMMLLFIAFRMTMGFTTILIAHITFNIPYVILSVMPKLKQTNRRTYEAALDLRRL